VRLTIFSNLYADFYLKTIPESMDKGGGPAVCSWKATGK